MPTSYFQEKLHSVLPIQKKPINLGVLLFWPLAISAVAVYLWRCQFGLDLTDEPFYLVPAWKMFSLGDKPFSDEIFNGVRHSDLLNYLFVKPFVPYSVLLIRQSSVIVYSCILALFTVICFRGRLGLTALLAFVGCLTCDQFLMPTWSYNWWARNFLLLHHSLLILSFRDSGRFSKYIIMCAGAAMGVVIVAYNSLLPLLPITAFTGFFLEKLFKKTSLFCAKNILYYISGGLFVIALDIIAIYLFSVKKEDWLISVHSMSIMAEYASYNATNKAFRVMQYILGRYEAVTLFVMFLCAYAERDWTFFLGRYRKTWIKLKNFRKALVVVTTSILLFQFSKIRSPISGLNAIVALGFCGFIVLILQSYKERTPLKAVLAISTIAAALGMALSSVNSYGALFWALPAVVIPFCASELQGICQRFRSLSLKQLELESSGYFGLLVLLGVFVASTAYHQATDNYYDVPPSNCSTEVNTPPLKGILTSPRRAFMAQELSRLVGDRDFVLSFAETPGPLYFGKARASVDTSMVEQFAPMEIHLRSLNRMVNRNRIPSLAIRAKVRPWYWGIHSSMRKQSLPYPKDDQYIAFLECAKGKKLANYDEFEAYEIDSAKVSGCIKPEKELQNKSILG